MSDELKEARIRSLATILFERKSHLSNSNNLSRFALTMAEAIKQATDMVNKEYLALAEDARRANSLEKYLRACKPGDPIVIRAGWSNHVNYTLTTIADAKKGRVYTSDPGAGASRGRAFYMRTGNNCHHPNGQTWLLEPTPEHIELTKTGFVTGVHGRLPEPP